eukprot:Hpha_TRINITY_DN12745_c0_g1::TRINITY_DN12745_c0_g1_i1::g.114245::m.114245
MMTRSLTIHHIYLTGYFRAGGEALERVRTAADETAKLVSTGVIPDMVQQVTQWANAKDALLVLRGRHLRGKLVVDLAHAHPAEKRPAVFAADAKAAESAVTAHPGLGAARWAELQSHAGQDCNAMEEDKAGSGLVRVVFADKSSAWVPPASLSAPLPAAPPAPEAAAPSAGETVTAHTHADALRLARQTGTRYYVPPQYHERSGSDPRVRTARPQVPPPPPIP